MRFDGDDWSDVGAIDTVRELPGRWVDAVSGMSAGELGRRPGKDTWSIAEYVDHVREVLFGMRFLLDVAVTEPGRDLGTAPAPRFDPEARLIDIESSLTGLDGEATQLCRSLVELDPTGWASTVTLDGEVRDPHWIVRHAVHDATHHLLDVERIRAAL